MEARLKCSCDGSYQDISAATEGTAVLPYRTEYRKGRSVMTASATAAAESAICTQVTSAQNTRDLERCGRLRDGWVNLG